MNHEEREKTGKNDIKVRDYSLSDCMVSVSCISFNHVRYIRQAIEGFLSQKTDFKYEILIHDDASTDGTDDIIREYAAVHPDIIKPILQQENQYSRGISNISGVFNFPRAEGRYIAMCEGDDYWSDRHKLQKQVDFMESHPDFALCCHSASILSEDGAFRTAGEIRPYERSGEIQPEAFISRKSNIPTASMFFRTEYAKRLPNWYFDCPVGDIPLQLFMLMKGRVYYDDSAMSVYRMGAAGSWGSAMDAEGIERQRAKWEAHYAAMKKLYEAFDADTASRWHGAVAEALKRQRFAIDLKEGNAEAVLDKDNELFVSELPHAEARLQRLKALHPHIYSYMRDLYLKVKGTGR